MVDLVITAGQHRNEKSAIVLAPLVTKSLIEKGHDVLLLFNPERRTLLEIAMDAFKNNRRITKKQLEKILHEWEDKEVPAQYRGVPIFNFHNYGLNPTEFVPPEEHQLELGSINGVYSSMDVGDFEGDGLAYKVKYEGDKNGALIEIPEITETFRKSEEIAKLRRVFHPKTFTQFQNYFLSTDLDATQREGYMDRKVVDILAHGIEYLIHTKVESC